MNFNKDERTKNYEDYSFKKIILKNKIDEHCLGYLSRNSPHYRDIARKKDLKQNTPIIKYNFYRFVIQNHIKISEGSLSERYFEKIYRE